MFPESYYPSSEYPWNIRFSEYDMVQSYMIFGGIPYYLGYIDGEYSLARNVDEIFFAEGEELFVVYTERQDNIRLFSARLAKPERTHLSADGSFNTVEPSLSTHACKENNSCKKEPLVGFFFCLTHVFPVSFPNQYYFLNRKQTPN